MENSVTDMELGNNIACFLARSADYLDVPAGEGMVCGSVATQAGEEAES